MIRGYKEVENDYRRFRSIKSKIDKFVEEFGINSKLVNYEEKLNRAYSEAMKCCGSINDKHFLSFNYYGAKSYICLVRDWKYKAIEFFFEALLNFIEYLKNISDYSKWGISYYKRLLTHILNRKLELFGNTGDPQFASIMNVNRVIQSLDGMKECEIKEEIQKLVLDFIFAIVVMSGEVYSEKHIKRWKEIYKILALFKVREDFANGILNAIKFVLLKKILYYHVRRLVPSKNKVDSEESKECEKRVKKILLKMEEIANLEYESFKKSQDGFKIFLALLDKLTCKYYEFLWVKGDLIKALKVLEGVFSLLRKNVEKIYTPEIFSHFVEEYMLLSNYLKLHLLRRDFEEFGDKASKRWQKEIASIVVEELATIAERYFKYRKPESLERELLVIEQATSGKFIEFVVFYILRELISSEIDLKDVIPGLKNKNLYQLFTILSNVGNREDIEWDVRFEGYDSDIDIFISKRYALFLKSGILNSKDRRKIYEEIELSQDLNLDNVFIIIDIAKNLEVVEKIRGKLYRESIKSVILLDIGDFLRELLKIAHEHPEISFNISKSGILSYAGFYSAG